MDYGFLKVAVATPLLKVADVEYNADNIIEIIKNANNDDVKIILFPELCITSASCGDMFKNRTLISSAKTALDRIICETKDFDSVNIVGLPILAKNKIFNCAVEFKSGEILNIYAKQSLSETEKRCFSEGNLFDKANLDSIYNRLKIRNNDLCKKWNICCGVAIGKDLKEHINDYTEDVISVPFVFPEIIGYYNNTKNIIKTISEAKHNAILFASAGVGESSTDNAYGGGSLIVENGKIVAEGNRFCYENSYTTGNINIDLIRSKKSENLKVCSGDFCNLETIYNFNDDIDLNCKVSQTPFIPEDKNSLYRRCEEIFNIQTTALIKRFQHTNSTKAVIGISGGLDSTLALLVAVNAFDKMGISRNNITAITMPGFGTTSRTYNNAVNMIKELGAEFKEISIKDACLQHFKDIEHNIDSHDITYENSQARERTQILMDYANKIGALHLGTGDMSELALGWATYNGDHISMYNVNCNIPKTLAKYLVVWFADKSRGAIKDILLDVVNTPISPELTPADDNGNIKQKTEDIVGPYELHDFFLYYLLRYGCSVEDIYSLATKSFEGKYDGNFIKHWLKIFFRRFITQQFKRSCLNDGPAVGIVSLSPRGGMSMPSDMACKVWLDACDKL